MPPPRTAPQDDGFWWALEGPRRLAGCAYPRPTFDYDNALRTYGLTRVVSLVGRLSGDVAPLLGISFDLQDLHNLRCPDDSAVEWQRVTQAATAVREMIDDGEGVLVHCLGGIGRTGTVIGAVLASYGTAVDEVALWLDEVHRAQGHPGWPECPWQRQALAVLISN